MKKFSALALLTAMLAACSPAVTPSPVTPDTGSGSTVSAAESSDTASSTKPVTEWKEGQTFGAGVKYAAPSATIDKGITAKAATSEAANLKDIEKAFGFTFSAAEKKFLNENNFVMKDLLSTDIRPSIGLSSYADRYREFLGLYRTVAGKRDYKERAPENAIFFSSDIFLHSYMLLFTELLKEMENKTFAPAMKDLSKTFFEAANKHLAAAKTDADKKTWTKVRNYFAVPYALMSTAQQPLTTDEYMSHMSDPDAFRAEHDKKDKTADTYDTAAAFIKTLKLDAASEKTVLADLQIIFKAEDNGFPALFADEYVAYGDTIGANLKIDFTQYTPRSHYTGNSLRRQYFRTMTWYIQNAFFVGSPELTGYAFGVSQLMAENPKQLAAYGRLESAVNFFVGTSDDLMPADYLKALDSAKGSADQEKAIMDYLLKARQPKIKAMTATYPTVGQVQTADIVAGTKGMRFFSGKFILDSYWTGQLTQGDEAPKPGYTQKLPPMASSLEVMALLGSEYAKSKIPTLDFYKPQYAQAVDQAMKELTQETATLDDGYWQSNLYTSALSTIRSLFDWTKAHKTQLPAFMQSPAWDVKTLMTASGFWTELRHATLLYAKQSFAELGGGGGCDDRKVPPPPKSYIEPQPEVYAKLQYMGKRAEAGLTELGFDKLENFVPLQNFNATMQMVTDYTTRELGNAQFAETVKDNTYDDPDSPSGKCTEHNIDGKSDWEALRNELMNSLELSLPIGTDGPVLAAKDKRVALVADVHTGGDSQNPTKVLYEGIGVPKVIFVLAKDKNGPRLTTGFTYAHSEFTEAYGGKRLTDEDWQKKFYVGTDDNNPWEYADANGWPATAPWYDSILKIK